MKIVCNASPLINLARIGQLDLLRQLYTELSIPRAVWDEVVEQGAGQPGAEQVKTASWIKTMPISNMALVQVLRQDLDPGEAERDIARAVELESDHVFTHARQGELALARGQYADALAHFQFAAEHSEDVGWQLELAIAHFANGNTAEAQKILDAALPKANDDNRENAREWLERVVKLRPDLAVEAEQIRVRLKMTG